MSFLPPQNQYVDHAPVRGGVSSVGCGGTNVGKHYRVRFDAYKARRDFPARWSQWCKDHFRSSTHLADSFDVSEKTARLWIAGSNCPMGWAVDAAKEGLIEGVPPFRSADYRDRNGGGRLKDTVRYLLPVDGTASGGFLPASAGVNPGTAGYPCNLPVETSPAVDMQPGLFEPLSGGPSICIRLGAKPLQTERLERRMVLLSAAAFIYHTVVDAADTACRRALHVTAGVWA